MKLLAISFGFPPVVAPRSIQVGRLLQHLDAETTVICGLPEDESLDPTIEPGASLAVASCVRVPHRRSRIRRRLEGLAERADLPVWNRTPDAYRRWGRAALAAARSLLASGFRPDVLASFGNPMTDHLVGLELARETGLPWVAHFSDPWTRNPLHIRSWLDEFLNRRLERLVHRRADVLLYPSSECADHMVAGTDPGVQAKVDVLPHSFRPELEPEQIAWRAGGSPGPLVVRHIGELYSRRRLSPVTAALQEIASHDPALLDGVRFEFIGVRDPNSLRGADVSLLPSGVLSLHDRVSYEESVSLMRSSDGLLVLDGAWQGKGIFFPSKLADYIGAGRPIMGIASPGAGAGIIERLGGVVAEVGDPAAIALGLRRFLAMVRAGRDDRGEPWGNPGERSQYAAPAVAAQFREQLGRAMAARGHPLGRVGVGVLSSALT
jgi:hypothetical protein